MIRRPQRPSKRRPETIEASSPCLPQLELTEADLQAGLQHLLSLLLASFLWLLAQRGGHAAAARARRCAPGLGRGPRGPPAEPIGKLEHKQNYREMDAHARGTCTVRILTERPVTRQDTWTEDEHFNLARDT